jgi:dipeptidyl aminopeptidase/acylaminoacyl peptidase
MDNVLRRRVGAVVRIVMAVAAMAANAPAMAQTPAAVQRPPAAAFVGGASIGDVVMSPSGEWMALLATNADGRVVLSVVETAKPTSQRVVAAYRDADVVEVNWVNDRRLVYVASQPGVEIDRGGRGIFAVDRDGGRERQLVAWDTGTDSVTGSRLTSRLLPYEWELAGTLQDGTDDVLLRRFPRSPAGDVMVGQLARVDTNNLALRNLSLGAPVPPTQTLLDAKGVVRVVRVVNEGKSSLFWRAPGGDEWVLLDERDHLDPRTLVPVALEGEDELIVETRVDGDTSSLHTYKLRERKLDREPIVAIKGFDIGSRVERSGPLGRLLGVHTLAAQPVSVWFEPHLAAAQGTVDKALPAGRVNRIVCGRCEPGTRLVIHSRSDTEPGQWYLYDPAARSLLKFGDSRPALSGVPQGRRTAHRVSARDGLSLPVWVTHPPGVDPSQPARPLPTVVLVHGGPWLRGGSVLWSAEAQFLASRGWRVIEPEFRGSAGFGDKHFRAGMKQWGLAMQDDLADALAWGIAGQLVDPKRVCIYGASYGGYAALMGPIRHPELYRCAASYVGVTDIELMYTATWGDFTRDHRRYTMPMLVGDPKNDAAQLARTSPIKRVAEIRVPVLLGQGLKDRRVPREHADKFERAARSAGAAVERVNYPEDGHGFATAGRHADWLTRLEAFFEKAFATAP